MHTKINLSKIKLHKEFVIYPMFAATQKNFLLTFDDFRSGNSLASNGFRSEAVDYEPDERNASESESRYLARSRRDTNESFVNDIEGRRFFAREIEVIAGRLPSDTDFIVSVLKAYFESWTTELPIYVPRDAALQKISDHIQHTAPLINKHMFFEFLNCKNQDAYFLKPIRKKFIVFLYQIQLVIDFIQSNEALNFEAHDQEIADFLTVCASIVGAFLAKINLYKKIIIFAFSLFIFITLFFLPLTRGLASSLQTYITYAFLVFWFTVFITPCILSALYQKYKPEFKKKYASLFVSGDGFLPFDLPDYFFQLFLKEDSNDPYVFRGSRFHSME